MSNGNDNGTPDAEPKSKKARQQLSLIIQPPVPRFPFLNNFFDVHVYLFDDSNQVKCGEEFEFPLQVRLMFDDKPKSFVEKDILEIDPATPQLGRSGKASFRVRLKDVSMNFDNRNFCLNISAVTKASRFYIAPVISDPMTVIRHRLRIRQESQPPTVWYKDEGGRDKCIEVLVDLVDVEGRRVHGQEVPLKVCLLYDDLHPVTKQDILKLSSDSKQAIDETGTATLRVRIEDVSKNHQSKGFVIKVGPDVQHSPLNSDISPDTTTSVSVRSKRNRRSKHPGGSRGGGGLDDDLSSLVGHTLTRSSMDVAMPMSSPSILHDAAQLDGKFGTGDAITAGGGSSASMVVVGGGAMGPAGAPLIKALSNVIAWTRTVVHGLYQIQWQLIGYESKPDGSPDINKPLFNIHNPNAIVTNILQSYRAETMDQLRYLVQALEPTSGGSPNAGGITNAPGSYGNGGEDGEPPSLATAFGGGAYSSVASSSPGYAQQQQQQQQGLQSTENGGVNAGIGGLMSMQQQQQQQSQRPPLPPMIRGKSGSMIVLDGSGGEYNMGLVPLVRESTYDLLAGMDPSWFADPSSDQSNAAVESQVHFIVAKEYFSNAYDTLGFPAFDQKQQLLGFYKEGRNDQGQTVAYYIPLPPGFTDAEKVGICDMLKAELNSGGDSVVEIIGNDLNQLKEKVLTYHWSRNSQTTTIGGGGMV